jgi:hypothetical protein
VTWVISNGTVAASTVTIDFRQQFGIFGQILLIYTKDNRGIVYTYVSFSFCSELILFMLAFYSKDSNNEICFGYPWQRSGMVMKP